MRCGACLHQTVAVNPPKAQEGLKGAFQGSVVQNSAPKLNRGPFPNRLHVLQCQILATACPESAAQHHVNIPRSTATMRLTTLFAGLFACLITDVAATALTYKLDANEKACFFTTTKKEGEKIAFYFAVGFRLEKMLS